MRSHEENTETVRQILIEAAPLAKEDRVAYVMQQIQLRGGDYLKTCRSAIIDNLVSDGIIVVPNHLHVRKFPPGVSRDIDAIGEPLRTDEIIRCFSLAESLMSYAPDQPPNS